MKYTPNQKKLKVALVKQDVDLLFYVYPGNNKVISKLLFSAHNKVGPLSIIEHFNADHIILKENYSIECQFWKHVKLKPFSFKHIKENRLLKTKPSKSFRSNSFSESDDCQGNFAVSAHEVDWSQYDIVFSYNVAVPYDIVSKHNTTLWCYWIGDPVHKGFNYFKFAYDCYLNQEGRGILASKPGNIDFPFTFLGPKTLENIIKTHFNRPSQNNGIYAEINCVTERPVTKVPQLESLQDLHPIRFHKLLIRENLTELYDAKYFVKFGGRDIRGNSILEAISAGTLVLMDPDSLFGHKELMTTETSVKTLDEIREKIIYFDAHPEAYQNALNEQRKNVQHFIKDCPVTSILNAHSFKTKYPKKTLSALSRFFYVKYKRFELFLFLIFHYMMLIRRVIIHKLSLTSYKQVS